MKHLRAVRLVNWYHFHDETLRPAGSCLLLGDNGCGKSTVLDALQLALVADLTEVRFNKAANENSRRNLYGYVRHKLGSEDESRPGQQRFGRGACNSCVALQIDDDRDPTAGFVCGVSLEAGESDTEVHKAWFVLPGRRVEDVPCLAEGRMVRTLREFRAALREIPGARLCPDIGTYRDEVRHRLGALPRGFHRLLVKALDFKPLGQVRDFVFHYLLDERAVDTASLQANLEHYKRLEAEAQAAQRRLEVLGRVCETGERMAAERRNAETHRFLSARAGRELAEEAVQALAALLEANTRDAAQAAERLLRLEEQVTFLRRERDRIAGLLQGSPTYQQVQALKLELERVRDDLARAQRSDREARQVLAGQQAALELLLGDAARDLRRRRPELLEDDLVGAPEPPPVVERLRGALARDGSLGGRDLGTWTRRLEKAAEVLGLAVLWIERALGEARAENEALEAELAELARGHHRYPDGAAALLHLLQARLKSAHPARPLCELLEVPHERWRDAVEGYLNTRRFDVLVDPADFPRALALYEKHKRAYPLPGRGEVFISGVGLVDVERMASAAPRREPRSLAAQVETDDPAARVVCDFLLGEVICCEDEQELRRHRRGITDSVMVYQNHVARQTPRETYARHYLGVAARLRRQEQIERRRAELSALFVALAADLDWAKATRTVCLKALKEAARLEDLVEAAERLPNLKVQAEKLARQLDSVDRSEIQALEAQKAALERELGEHEAEAKSVTSRVGALEGEAKQLAVRRGEAELRLAAAGAQVEEAVQALPVDLRPGLETRYGEERRARGAAEVREVFERQAKGVLTRVENLGRELVRLKTEYASLFGFAGGLDGEGVGEHAAERDLWRDSRLPEYRERIARARSEAIQQLLEDIIFRLRANLLDVRRQIDELNHALKEVRFGGERYEFTLSPAPDHKPFYDLIMDAGRFEKDSLFGKAALGEGGARRTLEELFERLVASGAQQVKTELEAKADYREYFDYDLCLHHADGSRSLYSRVSGDKSGGETQTPYYVAIFASMYRLYRQLASDRRPTFGLVLLDEAFGKMDEGRIAATLQFARELGLQLLMATPKERSELVAPYVETSLYLHKDPRSGLPSVFDFTKEFARDREVADADPAAEGPR